MATDENINITIKNCNNIDTGAFSIKKNSLNIKYAINGTGKSTIGNAILYSVEDQKNSLNSLNQLMPFKYIEQNLKHPKVSGTKEIKTLKVFNEKYIQDFVFLPNELIKGSFDIFIRNETYEKGLEEISKLVIAIKKTFIEDNEISDLINDLTELSNGFGRPTKDGIHASSIISKAFKGGNKIQNIPEELESYKDYIRHDDNYKWIKWQIDGQSYLDITENCPFCVSDIKEKKKAIKHITEVYDSKSVENLNKIIKIFHKLNKYFSKDTKLKIDKFIKNTNGYTDDEVGYLREIRDQIDRLNEKFSQTRNIGFSSLKDVGKVIDELKSHKINLDLYNHLKSETTQEKVDIVNDSIEQTLKRVGQLQGEINKQKNLIKNLIDKHKVDINYFLKNAGYKYSVDIVEDQEKNYSLKLLHNDVKDKVLDAKKHLSFGEKNAFALVLFMYDVLKNPPDLIILDDPISSFDKNKKYAIIDMLFRKEGSLKGKTILLLTHDFEPIIDMIHHHRNYFDIPTAAFLENINGKLTEKEIQRADVQTFIEINETNIKLSETQMISKLVYLRRLYEIKNIKDNGYQLISNLMHKREKPGLKSETGIIDMTPDEIALGHKEIKKIIPDFNYKKILDIINNDNKMKEIYSSTESNYEKLHLYRIIFDDKEKGVASSVIQKFINQSLHIENDYIYQLNPRKYQMVPQFVIDECDRAIDDI